MFRKTSAKSGLVTDEGRFAALSVGVVVLVLAAHVLWASRNRGPMFWDDALYASASLEIYDGFGARGLPGFVERFLHAPTGDKAPLISLLPVPLFLVFGRGSEWAFHAVGWLAFALVCLSAHRLVRRLSNDFGALVAVILLCITPLLAGLTRQFMVEVPLLAAVVLWHERLLRSAFLERHGGEWTLGVIFGFGMLLKVSFPLFILGSVLAGIGLRVFRGPAAVRALWDWKGGAVIAGGAIAVAAATVGVGGMRGYVAAGVPIVAGLLLRRYWAGRLSPEAGRSLVILGVAYLVAGAWYSENLIPLLRNAWSTSFGETALRWDMPLANYVAEIGSFGVSNLQVALLAFGAAAALLMKRRFADPEGEEGDPGVRKAGRWTLFLWLAIPLTVFLASHDRAVRLTLPCLAAVPIAGGLLGAALRTRARTFSTLWAGACAVLGGALFVSFSFGAGPVDRLAAGSWVFWGRSLAWDQGPPDAVAWPHRQIVRAAAGLLGDNANRTVFLLFDQQRLNWINLKLAAGRERLPLSLDYAGRFADIGPAAERAQTVPLLLVSEGGDTGPEWTETIGRALVARLRSGELGPVTEVYSLRLPDGGDLRFYWRWAKDQP